MVTGSAFAAGAIAIEIKIAARPKLILAKRRIAKPPNARAFNPVRGSVALSRRCPDPRIGIKTVQGKSVNPYLLPEKFRGSPVNLWRARLAGNDVPNEGCVRP